MYFDGGAWQYTPSVDGVSGGMADAAGNISLAFNAAGEPCVAFVDVVNADASPVVACVSGATSPNAVAWRMSSAGLPPGPVTQTRLAKHPLNSNLYLAFADANNNARLARWDGILASWQYVADRANPTYPLVSDDPVSKLNMAFDNEGNPLLVYARVDSKMIRITRNS